VGKMRGYGKKKISQLLRKKTGFFLIEGTPNPYRRCNIRLDLCELLESKDAENARTLKIVPNWKVSGTWEFIALVSS